MRRHYPSKLSARMLLAGLLCTAVLSPAFAATVLHEAFDGDNTTNLNGTAPNIRPGVEVWTSPATGTVIRTDGSIAATGGTSAWLPASLQSGFTYTLTSTVDIVWQSASVTPTGVAFTSDSTFSTSAFAVGDYALQVYRGGGWIFTDSGTTIASAGANTLFSSGTQNDYEIKLVLSTVDAQWTLAGWLGGNQVDLNGASAGMLYTFSSNPSVTGVGLGYSSSSFLLESFTLDAVAAVPEPSTFAFLAGGAVFGLAMFRRRRG